VPSVRSPTAIALAVAGVVLLVYAGLTGGAVIAFAVEAFGVTAALLAPHASRRSGDDDGDDPSDDCSWDDPGPAPSSELAAPEHAPFDTASRG